MNNLPPISSLRPFEATARLLSFSRAADELNVSQAAISKQVANLERHTGIELFTRKGRHIELTNAGEQLRKAITLSLSHISDTLEQLSKNQRGEHAAIAMRMAFASQFMASRLPDLQSRYPSLDLALVTTETNPASLLDTVDMAIVLGHEPQPQWHADFLFSEELFAVCSPAYLDEHPEFTEPDALAEQTLLHLQDTHWSTLQWQPISWEFLAPKLGCSKAVHSSGYTFESYTLLLQSAMSGAGVAIGWQHLVVEQLKLGHLVKPMPQHFSMDRKHYLIIKQDRLQEPRIKTVRQWVLEQTHFLR